MAPREEKINPDWKADITFVRFENEAQREHAYRTWVKVFLRAKEKEIRSFVEMGEKMKKN